jgi:uncharacterized membrane protein YidH (DUF202 family)
MALERTLMAWMHIAFLIGFGLNRQILQIMQHEHACALRGTWVYSSLLLNVC